MSDRVRAFVSRYGRVDGLSDREVALRAVALQGADVVSLLSASDAYLVAYAEARLDDWNPDQPRDETGKWSSGEGTVAGAEKSGLSAIGKAEGPDEIEKIAKSIGSSEKLPLASKAKLLSALSSQAVQKGLSKLGSEYSKESDGIYKALEEDQGTPEVEPSPGAKFEKDFAKAIAGEEGKDWKYVEDPSTGDQVQAMIDEAGDAIIESGEVVSGPTVDKPVAESPIDFSEKTAWEIIKHPKYKEKSIAEKTAIDDLMDAADEAKTEAKQNEILAKLNDALNAPPAKDQQVEGLSPEGQAKLALANVGIFNPTKEELEKKMASMAKGEKFIGEKTTEQKVEEKAAKPTSVLDAGKAARDAAKEAVLHAKAIREQFKKDPTNKDLETKLAAAENAAKAARAAARKAEKATSLEEAQKHVEKAKQALDKAASLSKGSASESVTVNKQKPVEKAKAAPKKSAASSGPAIVSEPPKLSSKIASLHANLTKAASQPSPEYTGKSDEDKKKYDAKEAAKKSAAAALAKHANAKTKEEHLAAAEHYEAVAKEAKDAGTFWHTNYTELAAEHKDSALPREKFVVTGKNAGTHVVKSSARPIDSIKGQQIGEKTFQDHREAYTAALSSPEKSAALRYSGSEYREINDHLREGGKPKEIHKNLDDALSKAPAPRDMIVYRGLSGQFAKKLAKELDVGDSYTDKGYGSTSMAEGSAFGGEVKLIVTVPKGYPAGPIPSKLPHEKEYLLRRNTTYQLTKKESSVGPYGDKITVMHVTVLHDEDN